MDANGEEKVEIIIDEILADPALVEGGSHIMNVVYLCLMFLNYAFYIQNMMKFQNFVHLL